MLHFGKMNCFSPLLQLLPQNQATEEVSKNLVAMKEILYGTNEKEPQTEAVAQLAQELYNSGLLSTLVADLQLIDFEVRNQFLLFSKAVLFHMFSPLEHLKIPTALLAQGLLTSLSKPRLSAPLAEPGQELKGISGPDQGFSPLFHHILCRVS